MKNFDKNSNIIKKIIFTAIVLGIYIGVFCLNPLEANAAATIYFIDPTCQYSGNGLGSSCAKGAGQYGAYNGYSTINWTPGTKYLQKKNSVYFGTVKISASGQSGNPISIGAYGYGLNPVITSRKPVKGTWALNNGIYSLDTGESIVEVFWAGSSQNNWENALEIPEDVDTPTSPAAGKWGQAGTTIYYNPADGEPFPASAGSAFYYSINTALDGVLIEGDYVYVSNLRLARSAHHGIKVLGNYCKLSYIQADHNGNSTSNTAGGLGIGNGIELAGIGNYVNDSVTAYNEDHGLAVERMEGVPKPISNWFERCVAHHNGDNGATLQGGPDGLVEGIFSSCEFYENGFDADYSANGVRFIYAQGEVINSKIHDNYGAGIELLIDLEGARTLLSGNVINNNNKADNGYESYQNAGITISRNYKGNIEIVLNNIVNSYGNFQAAGIRQYFDGPTGSLVIRNNNIYGHVLGIDVEARRDNIGLAVSNNIYTDGTLFMFNYSLCDFEKWKNLDFTADENITYSIAANPKYDMSLFLPIWAL